MEKKRTDNEYIPLQATERRSRTKTVGKKLEKDITREICDWLASAGFFFWRENNIPVFQRDSYGSRFRTLPKYTPRGLPDIIILAHGLFIALEVKVPEYWKFTDTQKEMEKNINANGGRYHLTTSLEDTQEYMHNLPI